VVIYGVFYQIGTHRRNHAEQNRKQKHAVEMAEIRTNKGKYFFERGIIEDFLICLFFLRHTKKGVGARLLQAKFGRRREDAGKKGEGKSRSFPKRQR
jgi:hypothetical protein